MAARDAYDDSAMDMDMSSVDDDETETDEDIGRPFFQRLTLREPGSVSIESQGYSDFEDNEDGANSSEDNHSSKSASGILPSSPI